MSTRRFLFVLWLAIAGATAALAQKPDPQWRDRAGGDGREGGETIATALDVPFPFADTGNTCDNVDDYDEVCPYPGSTSPDVVYTFVPVWDTHVDVDLLGSDYDTKVYVYDADLNLVACNDDYYPDYVSRIEGLTVYGGQRYYLVIDGYGGDCGNYVVTICEYLPCDFYCWWDDVLEGEPPLGYGYVDTYNGGCDEDPPVFQQLHLPAGDDELPFCATTGYYESGGQPRHDTDWFQVVAAGTEIHLVYEAPYYWPASLDVLFLDGCDNVNYAPYELDICENGELFVDTVPGQVVTLRVRPLHDERPPCGGPVDEYRLIISGIQGPVATEPHTWSEVKRLYR